MYIFITCSLHSTANDIFAHSFTGRVLSDLHVFSITYCLIITVK